MGIGCPFKPNLVRMYFEFFTGLSALLQRLAHDVSECTLSLHAWNIIPAGHVIESYTVHALHRSSPIRE